WTLGVALSVAVHAAMVGGSTAVLLVRGLALDGGPVDVEIAGVRPGEIRDLPLGAPAAGPEPEPARQRSKPRRHAPRIPGGDGELATSRPEAAADRGGAADAGVDDAGDAPASSKNLGDYGPAGSRLTVLLRVDRLRETPYVAAVDAILRHLPDRQSLLEGTGLDLYQSFYALLIATPNPRDDTVTFLAARHHLSDREL